MTSVVNCLMSIAMAMCLLLGLPVQTNVVFEAENCPADYSVSAVSEVNPMETMPYSPVIGEGVQIQEVVHENRSAPASEPVCIEAHCAIPAYEGEPVIAAVVDEGVHSEAAVWENHPAPAVEMDQAPVICEETEVSAVMDGTAYSAASVALDLPAPPMN